MYSSPIIKPIVEYTSPTIFKQISKNKFRFDEIINLIGYQFTVPEDDFQYLQSKLSDL